MCHVFAWKSIAVKRKRFFYIWIESRPPKLEGLNNFNIIHIHFRFHLLPWRNGMSLFNTILTITVKCQPAFALTVYAGLRCLWPYITVLGKPKCLTKLWSESIALERFISSKYEQRPNRPNRNLIRLFLKACVCSIQFRYIRLLSI